MNIYYIDRKKGKKEKEIVAGEDFLRWVYETQMGNTLLEMVIKRKIFSFIYGKLQDMPFSKRKIKGFVQTLSIDMKEAERENIADYCSFNDFFTRKLKKNARPISKNKSHLISPADGRILAYENIDMHHLIQVKGSTYTLESLINDEELAREYQGGICIVIRLCPADYHRFHFPDSGIPREHRRIQGHYYSVNPIALQKILELYCQNKREMTIFDSDNFGKILLMEVGATCVGSIVQTFQKGRPVKKGEEKGYFKFGGSTVILFLKKGEIAVDEDIITHTKEGIETKVNMGETLGKKQTR